METFNAYARNNALRDFRSARQKATLRQVLSWITGASQDLLSYEEVRKKLKVHQGGTRTLKDISLDAIVGSVNRYEDFTRDFLPKGSVSGERWSQVELANLRLSGLPPIEAYQIGEVFFVSDGNHRVSVARQNGLKTIQGYVTELHTHVPLSSDIKPEDLILKAEYAEFLEKTNLPRLRPEADLSVTVPGHYAILEDHISVHHYFMGLERKREIPYEEAITNWYDTVFAPVVRIIQARGLLRDFPDRTETDLYLWIVDHRASLVEELGSEIEVEAAARDLALQYSKKPARVAARLGETVLGTLIPETLDGGPPPGEWRKERLPLKQEDRLFSDILVPLNGKEDGWNALSQAMIVARSEKSRLNGLHVVASEKDKLSPQSLEIQNEFNRRCEQAGVNGKLILVSGEITRSICQRAQWNDLVIAKLAHPPSPKVLSRLSSGFSNMIQRSPRPILTVPQKASSLNRALLAYDGSPKADEALYVSTYLATNWNIPLVVVCVAEYGEEGDNSRVKAEAYLVDQGVQATFVEDRGNIAASILITAEEMDCDFLLMGSYGRSPILHAVIGSAVDQILRESRKPVLLCR